jgi:hypothetical protein
MISAVRCPARQPPALIIQLDIGTLHAGIRANKWAGDLTSLLFPGPLRLGRVHCRHLDNAGTGFCNGRIGSGRFPCL